MSEFENKFENKQAGPAGASEIEIHIGGRKQMIDTPDSARKPGTVNPGEGDQSLEEARLRQQAIGVKLRHLFDEVVNEPVPDEFLEILRRADERKANGGKA